MSYPAELTTETLRELIARRELYGYRAGPHRMKPPIEIAPPSGHLEMNSYQRFIENMFSPYTDYRSIHLMWSTGVGKTIGALAPAMKFIRVYRPLFATAVISRGTAKISRAAIASASASTPSVFVLGFGNTRAAFIRDLLTYTQFGFITETEREELQNLRQNASSQSESDVKRYDEFYSMLKRRITDKMKGGFFQFIGYNEFVNRLFYSETVKLAALETEAREKYKTDNTTTLESVVQSYIDRGEVSVNEELINMLQNSLLICDEIHETYNTMMKNSRGVALQYVLDRVPSLRLITMSATPINNSPAESVDFVNYHSTDKLRRSDIFRSDTDIKPDGKERLGRAMFGKISFVQDTDQRFFPTREIVGEPMVLGADISGWNAGESLPYLKFIKCELSPMQLSVHKAYFGETFMERAVPPDGESMFDIAFPSPLVAGSAAAPITSEAAETTFRTEKTKEAIRDASQEWRDTVGVEIAQVQTTTVIRGRYMRSENIGTYSSKYKRLLDTVLASYKELGPHKMLIYHNRVEMSGVVAIGEMLKENGIIGVGATPAPNTICIHCGKAMSEHIDDGNEESRSTHEFTPARLTVIHSSNDEVTNRTAMARFDDPSNSTGSNCSILIGSKLIRQGYDFKALRRIIVLSAPSSIYALIQIFGRGIRNNSHSLLDPENRNVQIMILVSTHGNDLTPEIQRYARKLRYHFVSQEIMREWEANSVDADINYRINMSEDKLRDYFPSGDTSAPPKRVIEALYYQPRVSVGDLRPVDITSATYYAHGHYTGTIRNIVLLVKYAFTLRPAWRRDDLYQFVHNPPVSLQYNPDFITREQFDAAMHYLLQHQRTVISQSIATESSSIYNFMSKFVQIGKTRHSIAAVGDYYIAIPTISSTHRGRVTTGEPIIDVETYIRVPDARRGTTFNLRSLNLHSEENERNIRAKILAANLPYGFLTAVTTEQQIGVVRSIIEDRVRDDFSPIMRLLSDLGALVTARQVRVYKAVDDIVGGLTADDEMVVGYADAKSIRIYNVGKWHTVKRAAMNRKIDYRENTKIVGILETAGDVTKLKLRRSAEQIKTRARETTRDGKKTTDTRTIERGMVCETQPRERLLSIMKSLGLKPQGRTRDHCAAVLQKLIELEIIERKAKTKTKYLYGWWSMPSAIMA